MTPRDVALLFAYDAWATHRLLDAAEGLAPAQFTHPFGEGFASVQGTLAHVIGAGALWLHRWQGDASAGRPAWVDDPSPATLRTQAQGLAEGQTAFLATLADDALARPVRYTLLSGTTREDPLGTLMLHAVNHGTHHRGQVGVMLRHFGVAPPPLDFLVFASLSAAPTGA